MRKQIILASQSPRRIKLLRDLGWRFKIQPAEIKEKINPALSPRQNARRLSLQKAQAVAAGRRAGLVISADTLGEINGQILGKPKTIAEARKMLRQLSGQEHRVITALTVIDAASAKIKQKTVITKVKFKKLDRAAIDDYLKQVNPLDKAAAYAIQEKGELLVESIQGDYHNVMGLPLKALKKLIKEI